MTSFARRVESFRFISSSRFYYIAWWFYKGSKDNVSLPRTIQIAVTWEGTAATENFEYVRRLLIICIKRYNISNLSYKGKKSITLISINIFNIVAARLNQSTVVGGKGVNLLCSWKRYTFVWNVTQNIGWVCVSAYRGSNWPDQRSRPTIKRGPLLFEKDIFEPPPQRSAAWLQDPFKSASFLRLFKAPPPVAKYSRSQPDRSLKQFRPGVCPGAVDRRLGEISSGRRRVSRSPRRLSRPPSWPIHGRREPRTLAGGRADPPSRFSFDSPDILSAYLAGIASAVRRILP